MRLVEILPGVLILALSAFVGLGTMGLSTWDGISPGPGFFPLLLAGGGVILAVVQFLSASSVDDDHLHEPPSREGLRKVALIVAGMIGLIVGAPLIGMVPAVAVLMAFLLLVVLRQPWLTSLAATVIVALTIEVVFVRWLGVPLPPAPFFA